MEIKRMKLADIKPALYNPRKDLRPGDPEYNKMKRSIDEFDCVEPLVWNKRSQQLVGGHQRLKILLEKGLEEFEVSVVDLDEKRERALNVALNKIQGDWDFTKLADLMTELDDGEFDLELTGFDMSEIEEIMNWTPKEEEPFDAAAEAERIKEPKSKRGEIYQLGRHRLMCGDATSREDVERLMDGVRADMVYCDPPYGMNLETDFSKMHHGKGVYTVKRFNKVIGDDGNFDASSFIYLFDYCREQFWWGADYYRNTIGNGGSWIVWDKRANEMGIDLDKVFGGQFELCWSKQIHRKEIVRILWSGHHGMAQDGVRRRVHPTQKPVALGKWFIEKFSQGNNIIIDLFGGSGSTLIACEQTNRICKMMEIDPIYCDVIINRWEKYTGEKAELIKQ